MALATTSLVLIALLVPMGLLVQRFVEEDALASLGLELQQVEALLARAGDREEVAQRLGTLNAEQDDVQATVAFDDDQVIGPGPAPDFVMEQVLASGQTVVRETEGGVEMVAAAYGRRDAAVIRLVVSDQRFARGVVTSWLVLAGLGVALLGLSLVVADRLGRSFVAPLHAIGETAAKLGEGDLAARVEPGGPPDVHELGDTFNQLGARIAELVALQREEAADLAHRLSTPLAALRLDIEQVARPAERAQLIAQVDALGAMVTALINDARRPVHGGVLARGDAVAVVRDRTAFWAVLAEDQGRSLVVQLPPASITVRVDGGDLAAALDALLGNVFEHTPEGTGCTVAVARVISGGAVVTVSDDGPGIPDVQVLRRGESRAGSTGLGLDIARRTCEQAGGSMEVTSGASGGTTVRMRLAAPMNRSGETHATHAAQG